MQEQLFVSVSQASEILGGLSKAQIYRLVKEQRLMGLKIGRRVLIPFASLKQLVNSEKSSI